VAINITSAGSAGVHSFKRLNVNTEDNFVYFKDSNIPARVVDGTSYIYSDGIGSITGVTDDSLVYADIRSPQILKFTDEINQDYDLTDSSVGVFTLNTPIVVDGVLNLGISTPTNQAAKYYTDSTPLTGLVSGNTYFLKNVQADFIGTQALYSITGNTHTFTTCFQTGRLGPTNSQILAGYSTSWHGQYLRQGDFQGYQDWTVPVSGVYEFTVSGASGFEGSGSYSRTINQTSLTNNVATIRTTTAHELTVGRTVSITAATNSVYNGTYVVTDVPNSTQFSFIRTNANIALASSSGTVSMAAAAGRGAIVSGRVTLTKGEIITIAVGQRGSAPTTSTVWGGSGGGTFVVRKTGNEPLFIAGGGSADPNTGSGRDGQTTNRAGVSTGGAEGGSAGNGGIALGGRSAAGGGFLSRGQNSPTSEPGGGSFVDGLTAAAISGRVGGAGGFGGGGNSDGNTSGQSGGAGGYSGGSGARTTTANHAGGGGGSYITPVATNVATSDGRYELSPTFNSQPITNLNSYRVGEGTVAMTIVSTFTTGNELYPTALDAQNGTNKINIQPNGSSYHSLVPINYDSQNDLIHSAAPHGLADGEAILLTFNGSPPVGLSNETIYYANKINDYTYRLSVTPGPSFTTINLTTPSSRETATSSRINRVIVNTATDTLTINNHGFLVNQPLRYDVGDGTPIVPLQDQATYYVAEVLNANQIRLKNSLDSPLPINLTSAGTGSTHSFIFLTVNAVEDTLYIPNHGLVSGQAVRYTNGGGTTIPGLVNDATYYIIKVDNSIVKLATNTALTSVANITGAGTGTQSLIITSLNFAANIITVPQHGFLQGELIQYDSRGQQAIAGLITATPYYVIFVDGDNIKLALTPDDADNGVAVDIQESPAGVGRHTLQSLSKTPDGIYSIVSVPSANTFTVEARGSVPSITKIFNPRTTIDLNANTFFIPSHGLLTETAVTYSKGDAGTIITGLIDNETYYVVAVNRDYLRLSTTAENAASGITLTVDDFGTGINHQLITNQINGNITGGGSVSVVAGSVLVNGSGTSFSKILKVGDNFRLFPPNNTVSKTFEASNVNTTTNRITFPTAHAFQTGDTVKFFTNGGVAPSPLVNEYYYFIRSASSTEITLHNSASDASGNIGALDITTTGTGTNFALTKTAPVSPIIRRITAVGSDTQITVDRPYSSEYNAVSYSYPTFVYVRPEGYSLHRPFDGGVEMSVGAKTSLGQIIRQTRKYFRYQSGKGLQTSAGINFKPSIDLESMERFSPTTVTCTTRRPHGLISGLFVEVSQAETSFGTPSLIYNGEFQVTVVNLTQFRVTVASTVPEGAESKAYGFPQFYVTGWQNGAIRSGMFDFQNGMFFEFDGEKLYCVRRSSTQQMAGSIAAQQGSELIFGTGTKFSAQLDVGDYIVLRGQSYRVTQIDSDTRMSVRPEYKGSSGTEKEFNPATVVNTTTDTFTIIGHGFSDLLPVAYNSIDGEPIGGLINGRTYYVDLVDNNNFKLLASPDSEVNVNLSSVGTTNAHSFVPAKSGIIVTKTVDTRIPQEDWSIDPCDGSGPTGYNLDLSRIQMVYIDYSWYGAGKIRFGFKTNDGQVQYVHEFVHNNNLYESYFRSGNLPARYEVVTYDNPTYIPFLFHWGTSVMMDGRFDDDNAYLFTASSQTLAVPGTTAKSFSASGIDLTTDLVTVQTHGFRTGDVVQFQSIASNGLPGLNTQHPATQIIGNQTLPNLTNTQRYKVFVNSPNLIHLTPFASTITIGATVSRSTNTVTVVTATPHNIPATGNNYVGVYNSGVVNIPNYVGPVTVTNSTTFTYITSGSQTVNATISTTLAVAEVLNFTARGNVQYTYFLFPDGSLNNTSGANYQPLISLRLSPSVSSGLTGKLGDRDVINRMQLRLQEIGVSSTSLVDVKLLLNPRLNNLNFVGVDSPSLTQIVEHTAADTVSGGVQVYNFKASGGSGGGEDTTTVDVSTLFELSNSILGGDSIFPDGPDIITIAVSRLTGSDTLTSAKMSWSEAQA
jgi:hypothetical protein